MLMHGAHIGSSGYWLVFLTIQKLAKEEFGTFSLDQNPISFHGVIGALNEILVHFEE